MCAGGGHQWLGRGRQPAHGRVQLFDTAPDSLRRSLAEVVTNSTRQKGDKIISQGQPGEGLYFLLKGKVDVGGLDPETEEWTRIQTMEAPDFFGERSLTGGEMTSADVIVSSESCLLLILAKRDFDTVVAEYPKFRRQMHQLKTQ